jgi:hypothetical protein
MSDACEPAASTRLSSSFSGRQPLLLRAWLVRSRTSRSCAFVPPPPGGGGGGSSGVGELVGVLVGRSLGVFVGLVGLLGRGVDGRGFG